MGVKIIPKKDGPSTPEIRELKTKTNEALAYFSRNDPFSNCRLDLKQKVGAPVLRQRRLLPEKPHTPKRMNMCIILCSFYEKKNTVLI